LFSTFHYVAPKGKVPTSVSGHTVENKVEQKSGQPSSGNAG